MQFINVYDVKSKGLQEVISEIWLKKIKKFDFFLQ